MSRDLSTFPFSQNTRFKLLNSGFVTVDDLRGFKPSELSKETQLTVQEAMDVLDLVFPKPSHSKSTIESKSCSALNILLEEKDLPPITTSCKLLDSILGGGISVKKVTEICGCPGSGKTQLCLQLCVNVQIPKNFGGLDGEAFFIDTEGSFIIQRLVQIASATVQQLKTEVKIPGEEFTLDRILKGIYYYPCKSYTEVIARINLLHEFLEQHKKIAVVIIDSIAFHFRYGFDGTYSLRTRLLNGIMQTLVKVANQHKVAVVLTNQMTTKIDGNESSHLVPALGESWGHACAIRLILSWTDAKRIAYLLKSPSMAEAKAQYTITKDGFRDASVTV